MIFIANLRPLGFALMNPRLVRAVEGAPAHITLRLSSETSRWRATV